MKWLATASCLLFAGHAVAAPPSHAKHRAKPSANQQLLEEVRALRAEVAQLRGKVDAQDTAQASVQQQAQVAQQQAQAAQQQVQAVQTQVAAVPPVTKDDVKTQIATAIDKEHHNDKFYYKGITITPGGFVELAGIYRSRFQGDDIASSFNVPFPGQSHQSHAAEGRFSARQSRFSLLAQGNVDKNTQLALYSEIDFQGAAQTSNSNQSNSYVPRLRTFYGTIDWNREGYGLHLLAGQNWSLLTMQGKGITPRQEAAPQQDDAQYIPGFAWARQPGVRLTGDFLNHQLWLAVAAENPQTTFGGTGVPANVTSTLNGQGVTSVVINNGVVTTSPSGPPAGSFQQFYNGAGSSLSLNHVPDFIAKAAVETTVGGHQLHVEGFGIYRTFSDHFDGTGNNESAHALGYGGSISLQVVPKLLDVQFSGIGGRGIGRYGSAGLPDVTFDKAGDIHPIDEMMLLAGATLHASPRLDLYAYAGEEQEYQKVLDGGATGYGLVTANNSGCFAEPGTTAATGACSGNTRRIRQLTGGFWDKFYQGSFGRAQVGIWYSYTQRQLFQGVGGMPQTHNNMAFVAFRYYPF